MCLNSRKVGKNRINLRVPKCTIGRDEPVKLLVDSCISGVSEGWKEGREEGRKERRMEGRKEGSKEGMKEGREEGWVERRKDGG